MLNKKNISAISFAFAAFLGTSASAAMNDFYARVDLGGSIPQKLSDKGTEFYAKEKPSSSLVYNVGLGYGMAEGMRADLNIVGMDHKFSRSKDGNSFKQNIKTMAVVLNGYYDIKYNKFSPYLMAGVGIARNTTTHASLVTSQGVIYQWKGTSKTGFTWNVGAGVGYSLTENAVLDLGYRFIHLGKIKSSTQAQKASAASNNVQIVDNVAIKSTLKTHALMAGLRISF